MKIKFNKIHLVNFLSFADSEITLASNGYVLVKGVNNTTEDLAYSNGSGKSSIWEAISWVLTGETIRGTKNIVNLNSSGGCYVELEFNIDGHEYKILRSKGHKTYKTNLKIFIDNEDKSGKGIRDTEQLLKQYLPDLTSSLIGSVIILGQGLPQRFSNNTPSGRKDILEKLTKSDFMINDLVTRLQNRKTILNTQLRQTEDEILTLNIKTQQSEQNITKFKQLISDTTVNEQDVTYLNQYKSQLTQLVQELNDLSSNEYAQLQSKKNNLYEEINRENEDYSNQVSTLVTYPAYIKYNEYKAKIIEQKTLLTTKEQECKKLEFITDVCPTCGQKLQGVQLPDTTGIKQEINDIKQVINELSNLSVESENEYKQYQTQLTITHQEKLNKLTTELTDVTDTIKPIEVSINNYNSDIHNLQQAITQLQNKIEFAEIRIKEYQDNIQTCETELIDIDNKLRYNNTVKTNIEDKLAIISKMLTAASRDFRGYLLLHTIQFINNKAIEYSKEVFNTDKIKFTLDGNNISISYDNKEYENLSGGEKQKVDLIIQLSIRDMLCKTLGFSSNILVLDELFDNLDDIGCQRVLNLIATKLNDVESIFIVTHHSDISIPYDKELIIEKGIDKISRVKNAL